MANISKIKLPNGLTYNLRDDSKLAIESVTNELIVLTYELTGTAFYDKSLIDSTFATKEGVNNLSSRIEQLETFIDNLVNVEEVGQ